MRPAVELSYLPKKAYFVFRLVFRLVMKGVGCGKGESLKNGYPQKDMVILPKKEQDTLFDTMQAEDCTPSHAQAIKLRRFSEEGRLNADVAFSILSEEKGNQKEQFRMPRERISKYFSPGTPVKQIEDTIFAYLLS